MQLFFLSTTVPRVRIRHKWSSFFSPILLHKSPKTTLSSNISHGPSLPSTRLVTTSSLPPLNQVVLLRHVAAARSSPSPAGFRFCWVWFPYSFLAVFFFLPSWLHLLLLKAVLYSLYFCPQLLLFTIFLCCKWLILLVYMV